MHCGMSKTIIEGSLLIAFVVGGVNFASMFYTVTPVSGIALLDGLVGFVIGSIGSVAILLGVLLLVAVIVEALFQGVLFVIERVVKQ